MMVKGKMWVWGYNYNENVSSRDQDKKTVRKNLMVGGEKADFVLIRITKTGERNLMVKGKRLNPMKIL